MEHQELEKHTGIELLDSTQKVPLAYHEISVNRYVKLVSRLILGWAVSIVLAIGMFVYLWLQYDYTGITISEYSGVYTITDSEGNIISSDIQPEDLPYVLEAIANGKSSQENGTTEN